MDKKYCSGCRNDFYNDKNPYGIKECWHLKKAKVVWRIPIGLWENPPYRNKKKQRVADCWQGEGSNKTIYIKSDVLDSKGYWR